MVRTSHPRLAILITIFCTASAAAQQSSPESKPAESKVITGRVVSESGQPISGANVATGISGGSTGPRTSTDNEGYFRLQGLDAGLYRIFPSSPGYVPPNPQADPVSFYRPGDSVTLTLVKGGVISGAITNIAGEPVVNVSVRAYRVRDAEGNKVRSSSFVQPKMTDDRGYYRLYGLSPGTYLVSAGGSGQYFGMVNPFGNDAPTYAPASTRDTAAEFSVRSGEEVTADIRYRGEPGHVISGRITGALAPASMPAAATAVRLNDLESQTNIAGAMATGADRAFQINAVSDGEYDIAALVSAGPNSDMLSSATRRITVKGADVTGLELFLAPLGSIAGRVVYEPDEKLNCGRRRDSAMRETLVTIRRDQPQEKPGGQKLKDKPEDQVESAMFPKSANSPPNEKGEVSFRNLVPATYRFEVRIPGAGWYLRDLSPGGPDQRPAANRTPAANIARNGIALKAGDKVSGMTITVAEGGAGLRGKIAVAEGENLSPGLCVYLAPAEREHSENVLRFFEGAVASDGTFAIGNLAPGRYWITAQVPEVLGANSMKSIRTDNAWRAKLLRDAEAAKKEITFKPCERTVDYELLYSPISKP